MSDSASIPHKYYDRLKQLEDYHTTVAYDYMSADKEAALFVFDFLVLGIINRSVSLVRGMNVLMAENNFTSAASLLRQQIDSLIKLAYIASSGQGTEVADAIVKGKQFNDLKTKGGIRLTEGELLRQSKKYFPWVKNVYRETSKFIHFSDKHCFMIFRPGSDGEPMVVIGAGESHWPDEEIERMATCFMASTQGILDIVTHLSDSRANRLLTQ